MGKDPAFLFYSDNFQSGTQFFTDEQAGKYIRILCAIHLHGHLTEKQVMMICKTKDEEIFSKLTVDSEGKYYQERLELEIFKRSKFTSSRSANRLGKTKSYKKHKKNTSKSYEKHMGNGGGNGNEIGVGNGNDELILLPFDSEIFRQKWKAWKEYRDEIGKPYKSLKSEQAALKSLSEYGEEFSVMLIEKSIANQWQGLIFSSTKSEYNNFLNGNGQKFNGKKQFSGNSPEELMAAVLRNNQK